MERPNKHTRVTVSSMTTQKTQSADEDHKNAVQGSGRSSQVDLQLLFSQTNGIVHLWEASEGSRPCYSTSDSTGLDVAPARTGLGPRWMSISLPGVVHSSGDRWKQAAGDTMCDGGSSTCRSTLYSGHVDIPLTRVPVQSKTRHFKLRKHGKTIQIRLN